MEWLYPAVFTCGMAALEQCLRGDAGRKNIRPIFRGALKKSPGPSTDGPGLIREMQRLRVPKHLQGTRLNRRVVQIGGRQPALRKPWQEESSAPEPQGGAG